MTKKEGFKEIVKKSWGKPMYRGNNMKKMKEKLKELKKELKQ